ncbi:hypothetical protein LWF15_12340 [Kineosporia rhizophila]|uniref:hypothetical protein n=1 Tax=Kineosporia rhizophila TaxID=84633 RepID=UPI001E379DEA|nr:hypothetical protein [Kineosporia rhizophila]MCE0536298.1 hypothetical protein [Kineosporia rhizophila]
MADGPDSTPKPRRRIVRRTVRSLGALLAMLLLVVSAAVAAFAVHGSGTVDRSIRSTGQDAYWLGHAWVDGRKTQTDVDALADQLEGTGIRDLYVHAGPYADDGTLDPALRPRASWLLEALHTALPQVRVQAWLGNVLADNRMSLASAATRARVLEGAEAILAEGWDGVHYDFEPARNGDQDFLDLLAATHSRTQAAGALLSVATPKLQPVTGLHHLQSSQWTKAYMRRVAGSADQIAIMAYDTFLPSERAFQGYIRRQTTLALDAVPADVDLLIGAPAYQDQKINRFDAAETVPAAIAGVQQALAGRARDRPVGLALYVDFDATEEDWASYRDDWGRTAP